MNCHRARCLLSDYVAQAATPEEMRGVREHVRDCAACADELKALERIVQAAAALGEREVPRDCWPIVRSRLLAGNLVSRGLLLRRRWGRVVAGVAAAAAVATVVLLRLPERPPTVPAAWGPGASRIALQTGVEQEYLRAYAAFRDGQPLASEDGVVMVSGQAAGGD